ncbi:glycosyltransferase [Microbulbifer sp. SAOS-129_SWC]|uniref:glycosyltransferase n=1 Tax=Microbulbifer sp. SAOS-129_SWC TaxID=3145235 RepID=UPI00321765EF
MNAIFVTIGTQEPFNRLVQAIDQWAASTREIQIYAQIGDATYAPRNMAFSKFLEPDRYAELINQCDLIVSHAGMGSILTAMEYSKPIIIMPRDHRRAEHNNDHQLGTARHFEGSRGIYVAYSREMLYRYLDQRERLQAPNLKPTQSRLELVTFVQNFIGVPDTRDVVSADSDVS